ncbi:MAG: hypothetical protein JOZ90_03720 [Alphaproteobacteria bacterium]|nr:hypothetical protein [Alphaproteobacteria bacterium]MBV9372662.1 hypothetical protein [Alphaproteobacteria bacterium]MBV9900188.1 hypothetical protein [Alphaproteobacteria bacterium]
MGSKAALPLPADFQVKDVVSLYCALNAAMNQLWAMYVVATFTAGAFAVTATNANSRILLLAGGIGFLAFTIGHEMMVLATLRAIRAAAGDIGRAEERPGGSAASLARLARPPTLLGAVAVHAVIDGCVVAAYLVLIFRVTDW